MELVKGALERKIVPPIVGERARAALLAASAAQLEHAPEPKARSLALDQAVEAAKLQPAFAPGVVMAARLLAEDGKLGRAAAKAAAVALEAEPITARIAGLMARAAFAAGSADEARVWLAQGISAPHEPDWSDLDPEGRAFAYHASDWARLVLTYAETGELIHPRHERSERALRVLPELPLAYAADAQPLLTEAVLYPVGDDFGHEEPADDAAPPAPRQRRPTPRRRPRAAK
jgi:HemY protein